MRHVMIFSFDHVVLRGLRHATRGEFLRLEISLLRVAWNRKQLDCHRVTTVLQRVARNASFANLRPTYRRRGDRGTQKRAESQ